MIRAYVHASTCRTVCQILTSIVRETVEVKLSPREGKYWADDRSRSKNKIARTEKEWIACASSDILRSACNIFEVAGIVMSSSSDVSKGSTFYAFTWHCHIICSKYRDLIYDSRLTIISTIWSLYYTCWEISLNLKIYYRTGVSDGLWVICIAFS